jgi:hypothetical protein
VAKCANGSSAVRSCRAKFLHLVNLSIHAPETSWHQLQCLYLALYFDRGLAVITTTSGEMTKHSETRVPTGIAATVQPHALLRARVHQL